MNTLDRIVERTLAEPLATARAHAAGGGRVIGYVGADVPVELILAADAFPLHLPSRPGPCPNAERYIEASFTPAIRAIAEQWLTGAFDFMDAMILPRSNDSAQRLYYYLCEIERRALAQTGPAPILYDLAKIPRPTSVAHSVAATRTLAEVLGADRSKVGAAIETRNRRRHLFARLAAARNGATPPPGTRIERLARASDMADAAEFDTALTTWLDDGAEGRAGPRLVLAGSAPPDERLHLAVESAGGFMVAEHGDHALDGFGAAIDVANDVDLIDALARHYQTLPYGSRTFVNQVERLLARATDARADAAIVWLIEEDEAAVWDLPAARRALAAAGVPVLALTRQRWDARDGALETIAAFVGDLEPGR